MTVSEILEIVDRHAPNMIDVGMKIKWLSDLDHKTFQKFAPLCIRWCHYTEDELDRELLIPDPYALDVYEPYLKSKIAAENMETSRYNTLAGMFNAAYEEFLNYENRTRRMFPWRAHRRFRF